MFVVLLGVPWDAIEHEAVKYSWISRRGRMQGEAITRAGGRSLGRCADAGLACAREMEPHATATATTRCQPPRGPRRTVQRVLAPVHARRLRTVWQGPDGRPSAYAARRHAAARVAPQFFATEPAAAE